MVAMAIKKVRSEERTSMIVTVYRIVDYGEVGG